METNKSTEEILIDGMKSIAADICDFFDEIESWSMECVRLPHNKSITYFKTKFVLQQNGLFGGGFLSNRAGELFTENWNIRCDDGKPVLTYYTSFKDAFNNLIPSQNLWAARDKDGSLTVFVEEPHCDKNGYWRSNGIDFNIFPQMYPDVTFENSPKKLVVK